MPYTYISYIPTPLLNDFIDNRVVPFVGAGFSKNAEILDGLSMPDWNKLGELAAAEIKDYEYDNNPIDALSYYELLYSRTKLIEFLMKALHVGRIKPGETHKEFCKLFTGTICTTNFDSLLEDTMSLLNRPISTIVTEDRLSVNAPYENRIIKLHGDFNHPDKMVITEKDYDLFLENNPVFATYVSNLFINNTMFLIGYSLDDNDFRGVWQIINNRLGGMTRPAYCITVGATQAQIDKYARRNIRVINLPGEGKDYKNILLSVFSEINDYVSTEKDKTAKSKDDRINEQLLIPSDNNKLCFISCSINRIAQLSSLLYPILRSKGITPVRIDDMLMPGDNRIDVGRTIIRKSKMAIVDISDEAPSVLAELTMLQSEKKRISIICESGVELSKQYTKNSVYRYSFDSANEDNKVFIQQLEKWIAASVEKKNENKDADTPIIFENASLLFQKKMYSACIVSACSELEFLIRKRYSYHQLKYAWFEVLLKERIISKNELDQLRKIRAIRNQIVHDIYSATREDATFVLDVFSDVLKKMPSKD